MPSNPLTQEEINDYTINRILNPPGYTGLSPYMPQGYFLSTPSSGDGPALWRLFDASFISSGTISPDRLGSGSVGLGDLYLADDGTWKAISIPPTPTLHEVTTAGNVTTNPISVSKLTVNALSDGYESAKFKSFADTYHNLISFYLADNTTSTVVLGRNGASVAYPYKTGMLASYGFVGNNYSGMHVFAGSNIAQTIHTNGNIGIGTTTNAGYKLDVNGTARATDTVIFSKKNTSLTTSTLVLGDDLAMTTGASEVKLQIGSTNSRSHLLLGQSSTRGLLFNWSYNATPANAFGVLETYGGTNPLFIQTVGGNVAIGTTTDSGAKFQVTGSITAASAIARGVYFNNTLVAAANNDVLVGLDINPTFTNGAFTGVSNYALRVKGSIQYIFTTGDGLILNRDGAGNYIQPVTQPLVLYSPNSSVYQYINNSGVGINTPPSARFHVKGSGTTSSTTTLKVENSSATPSLIVNDGGSVLIGTTTDAGYKLDVNGTLRVSGVASLTSIINQSTLVDGAIFNADTNVITITGGRGNNSLGVLNISTTIGSFAPNFGGDKNMVNIGGNFTVGSSATGNVNFLAINPTINYPVGSSGIQRGIYLNPTLTRVTDYRAIEVVTGNVIFGSTSGSVGIGTTTPNYTLDVYQTNVKAQIRSTGENQNATLFLGTPFGGTSSPKVAIIARAKTSWSRADLAFCLNDNQSSNSVEATISDLRMVILSDGKVGVNVANPTYQFQVSGDIALSGNLVPTAGSQTLGTFTNRFGDVWAGGLIVGSTFYGDNHQSASGTLYFKDGGGVEKMRMTSVGNFLIGTITDTGEKLQVNGTVRASAFAIGATAGWTGTINIPTNPPGQQNIDVQGGIITNVS